MTKNVYYLTQNARTSNSKKHNQNLLNLIQPFWFHLNEANHYSDSEISDLDTIDSIDSSFKILFSVLVLYSILVIYFSVLSTIKSGQFELTTDINYLYQFSFNIIKSWKENSSITLNVELFNIGLSFLFHTFFIAPRILIAFANLLGIRTKDYIDSPWKSKSFSEFFTRTMVYYNMLINLNFYYPFMSLFKKLPNIIRKNISFYLALVLGGFIIHLFKDSYRIFQMSFYDFFIFECKSTLIYLFLLSTIILISQLTSANRIKNIKSINYLRFTFYIYLYSLTLPFTMHKYIGSMTDVFKFYLKLFFI